MKTLTRAEEKTLCEGAIQKRLYQESGDQRRRKNGPPPGDARYWAVPQVVEKARSLVGALEARQTAPRVTRSAGTAKAPPGLAGHERRRWGLWSRFHRR
jgi:hypothetical protein